MDLPHNTSKEGRSDADAIYDPGGLCVVRAGYEGVRPSRGSAESKPKTKPIRTMSSESIQESNFDEVESIVSAMDSMNIDDRSSKLTMVKDLLLDFSNQAPDRYAIYRGGGFLTTVMGERFVITCGHIMIRSAAWYRAYFKIDGEIEMFELIPHSRIQELDLMIMRFENTTDRFSTYDREIEVSKMRSKLQHCPDTANVDEFEPIRNYRVMIIDSISRRADLGGDVVTNLIAYPTNNPDSGEYDVKNIRVDRIVSKFSTLITSMIEDVPIVSVPLEDIEGFDEIRTIEERYQKKLEDAINYKDKRSIDHTMVNQVYRVLAGISGSLIYSSINHNAPAIPIGMVVTFNMKVEDEVLKTEVRAVPFDVILVVIDNCIRRRISTVMGIQVSYIGCIAEEENGEEFDAAIVSQNSSRYVNGRKDFWFNRSDLILKIDQKPLQRERSDLVVESEEYGRVPINAYLFYKANTVPGAEIGIMIPKLYKNSHKKINYNITPVPYSDMFVTRSFHQKEILWRGYMFFELSEEMIRFYANLGIDLKMFDDDSEIRATSANGERIVLLFNYARCFDENGRGRDHVPSISDIGRRYLTQDEYSHMPCTDRRGDRFFYQLEKVSNRTVGHIDELDRIIDQIDKAGQKKITLLLRDRNNDRTIRMNM
jgi:hypothetical protein